MKSIAVLLFCLLALIHLSAAATEPYVDRKSSPSFAITQRFSPLRRRHLQEERNLRGNHEGRRSLVPRVHSHPPQPVVQPDKPVFRFPTRHTQIGGTAVHSHFSTSKMRFALLFLAALLSLVAAATLPPYDVWKKVCGGHKCVPPKQCNVSAKMTPECVN